MRRTKGFWGWLTATFPPAKPGGIGWKVANLVTALHVWIFERSGGRVLGTFDGAPLLVLYHRGAKTGAPRRTPMIHLPDGDRAVVVASVGGNPKHPAWYHNLLAHPDIEIQTARGRRPVRARLASDAEAAALWPRLLEMWPAWATYMTRTTRTFPVLMLEPRGRGAGHAR